MTMPVAPRHQRHHHAAGELTVDAAWVRRQREAHEIGRRGIERHPVRATGQVAHVHQSSSPAGIVIGSRDIERRAIARQWLRRGETNRPEDDVVDQREEWEVIFRLPDMTRAPLGRGISAGVGQSERRDGGGDRGRRRADVESRVRCDGRPRDDVPPSEPFCPDEVPPAPTATDTPGRFCSNTAARTSSRARSTAAAYCGDGAESMTDGTACDCAKRGALTTTSWVRNAANAATTTPRVSAVRAAHIGSRLRAALTPSTTPTAISSMPMTAAPGASSASAT